MMFRETRQALFTTVCDSDHTVPRSSLNVPQLCHGGLCKNSNLFLACTLARAASAPLKVKSAKMHEVELSSCFAILEPNYMVHFIPALFLRQTFLELLVS